MPGTAPPDPQHADPTAGGRPSGPAPDWLAELAASLRGSLHALCDEVLAELAAAEPALTVDAELRARVERATAGLLAQLPDLLADPAAALDDDPPGEVLALVASLGRAGTDPARLIRACRVGQHVVWRWLMAQAARRVEPSRTLIDVVELASARLFDRTDVVVDRLLREWWAEHDRSAGGAAARRATVVRRLLAGEDDDVDHAAAALGFALDRTVCAAVLWDTGGGDPQESLAALERVADVIARAAGTTPALTVPVDEGGLWTWAGAASPPDLDGLAAAARGAVRAGQSVAFGTPAAGLRGFRVGHAEARQARRVAELSGRPPGVVRYDEVEAVSLLAEDVERLARFVRRTLGDLAVVGEPAARLRRTLRVWLATGGSAPAAAARLGVHKNTVLYRVHRADGLLPRPVDTDRLSLELALAAAEEVGLETLLSAR